jgi:hypothetical protein
MNLRVSFIAALFFATGCQIAGKHKDDANAPNGANDQNTHAVQSSLQAGSWPKPLVTLAGIGDESQDIADSSQLASWMKGDQHLYVSPPSNSTGSASTKTQQSLFADAYNCVFSHYKATFAAKGELIAVVIAIDADSCLDSYKKAADELASSMTIASDSSNSTTAVSAAFEFPLSGRGYRVWQCPGADMTSFNGRVVTNIIDLDTSSTTDATMLAIRKSCTFQDNWSQPKMWQTSITGSSYRIWVRKDNNSNLLRTEKTKTWKTGTMSSSSGPCSANANGIDVTIADCVIFSSTKFTQASGNDNGMDTSGDPNHDVVRATNLKRSGGKFYNAGTVNFEKGSWKGSMTYTSDTVAPTWNATDAIGETASGSISGSSTGAEGFNLTKDRTESIAIKSPSWFLN